MATQHLEAVAHLAAGRKAKSLEVARYNPTDPNLSRYYRMKNPLLVAAAEDNWYERERSRDQIEKIWHAAHELTKEDDTPAQKALGELRHELDTLNRQLQASAPEKIDDSLLGEGKDDGDDALSDVLETEVIGDDEEAVRAAEMEMFCDDSNIIAMYQRAAAAGRAAREVREGTWTGSQVQRR